MNKNKVSLQINLSPTDLSICRKLLERQISFWYDELDEVILSVETQKSYGRFALNFDKNKDGLMDLTESMMKKYPKTRYHNVDYSPERNKVLAGLFFNTAAIPHKDYRGGPFYSYFDGLAQCRNSYVIHLDSDIILGGIENSWLQDAIDLLNSSPEYFILNPLAGPPSEDGDLKQSYLRRLDKYRFLFSKMSTRVFLVDKEKFSSNRIHLRKSSKSLRSLKWYVKNKMNWGYELPEILISEMMERNQLLRVDSFGEGEEDACFTLHPLVKPTLFIEAIPFLLERIDKNDIPDSQRGYYNIHNDFFDFTKA